MPKISRNVYTTTERERYDAAYKRLLQIVESAAPDAPDACKFHCELETALAEDFPIDWPDKYGYTLLHWTTNYPRATTSGLPQVLIDAGADVNLQNRFGRTPLGAVCWYYVQLGSGSYSTAVAVIDSLLEAGARPELDKDWETGWLGPERQEKDRLRAYIYTWHEIRARNRAAGAAPKFDYAL